MQYKIYIKLDFNEMIIYIIIIFFKIIVKINNIKKIIKIVKYVKDIIDAKCRTESILRRGYQIANQELIIGREMK
jgi:hypothetical protein